MRHNGFKAHIQFLHIQFRDPYIYNFEGGTYTISRPYIYKNETPTYTKTIPPTYTVLRPTYTKMRPPYTVLRLYIYKNDTPWLSYPRQFFYHDFSHLDELGSEKRQFDAELTSHTANAL